MSTDGKLRELLTRSLATVAELKARVDSLEGEKHDPIAVVGMSCRLPGKATDPDGFWRVLDGGIDAVGRIPEGRLGSPETPDSPPATRWAALLESVEEFDPAFFGMTAREAIHLDPQQRLLLEVVWEAFEHAGIAVNRQMGSRTGVYVGMASQDYARRLIHEDPARLDPSYFTGNMVSMAAARTSYTFGFNGPSMTIDTACSSSLVALHLACQSLRAREIEQAVVGGVHLILARQAMEALARTLALSPDGRCRSFDAGANGFVRGEGCVVLVLKRFSDAQRAGDRILALLRGSAVNQDGRSTGLTIPNGLAQRALLRQALSVARVAPEDLSYLEAHGTGTSLGDTIELEALKDVLGRARPDGSTCALGSVKTNLGHLEAAGGLAGVMKVILALQHETIPPNLHYRTQNPRASLEGTPFFVPVRSLPWPRSAKPRRAGVSALGLPGTNAHVIVEEPPVLPPVQSDFPGPESPGRILPLSARTDPALRALALAWIRHLDAHPGLSWADVCHTAATGRCHFEERLAVLATSAPDAREKLEEFVGDRRNPGLWWGRDREGNGATPDPGDLARRFVRGEEIDWAAESTLPPELQPVLPYDASGAGQPRRVLLTGGTSFLGAYLLDELLRQTNARVACLVEAHDPDEAMRLLEDAQRRYGLFDASHMARVEPLAGDPGKPCFGLPASDWRRLEAGIDGIVHHSPRTDLFSSYHELSPWIVEGVRSAIRLACSIRAKPLHHISSLSVLPAPRGGAPAREDDEAADPGSLVTGFSRSMAVAERLLRESSVRGLPVSLYRVGAVAGCDRTGAWCPDDPLGQLFRSWVLLGQVPAVDDRLAVAPVNLVARGIVALSLRPESHGRTFHLTHPEPVTARDLARLIRSPDRPLEEVYYGQWRRSLELYLRGSGSTDLSSLLPFFPPHLEQPREISPHRFPPFPVDCTATMTHLEALSVRFPPVDRDLMERYFEYFRRSGLLGPAHRSS